MIFSNQRRVSILKKLLREKVHAWRASDERVREIGISIGCVFWKPEDVKSIFDLIKEADMLMYQEKNAKGRTRD